MTLSRPARGAVFAVVVTVSSGLMSGVCLAQAAPGRSAEALPAVTMPDFSALVERYGPAVVNVEVVGINSQIFSQTGSYMGLSFAIPIDIAVNVENQIIKTGHVVRGRIGVEIRDVDAAFADAFGLGRPRGALVQSVEAGGPAEKAGIKPGDIIIGVNGQNINYDGELSLLISNMHPGTDAHLSVWRERKAQDLTVKIALVSDDAEKGSAKPTKGPAGSGQAERLGLTVHVLTPDEKQEAQTNGALVVESVTGPAAAGGVQPGDIILGINGKPVHNTQDLVTGAKSAGKTVALLIQRQDQQIFMPLRLN